jgi:hypothetical protein
MTPGKTHRRQLAAGNSGNANQSNPVIKRPRPSHFPVTGLPQIGPEYRVALAPSGNLIFLGHEKYVDTYAITREETRVISRHVGQAKLPVPIDELVTGPDDIVFAITQKRGNQINFFRVELDKATKIGDSLPRPIAVAATRNWLVAAIEPTDLFPARLVALSRRDGRVLWQEQIRTARVHLRTGRDDDEILVADSDAQQLRVISVSEHADNCRPTDPCGSANDTGFPKPQGKPDKNHEKYSLCCCFHMTRPGRLPEPRSPIPDPAVSVTNQPLPRECCIPGSDGDVDKCIVTFVRNGEVFTFNRCVPGDGVCKARLRFHAETVTRTPRTLVVKSTDRRYFAILDANTLDPIHHHRNKHGELNILTTRNSDQIFVQDGGGVLMLLDPEPVLPASPTLPSDGLGFMDSESHVVYAGESQQTQYQAGGMQFGQRNVLIVPVLEPGQHWYPLSNIADYAKNYQVKEMLENVKAFYEEATYHQLPDHTGLSVNFLWFGTDETPFLYNNGPPLRLPKPFRDYYGPAWDPGNIQSSAVIPSGELYLTFSGDEILRLKAIPSDAKTYAERVFTIRFSAGNYRGRIPNSIPTLSFGPTMTPRRIFVEGTDRNGNSFTIDENTSVLSSTTSVDLKKTAGVIPASQLEALADVIEEMLTSAPGGGTVFEKPSVIWQDDGDQAGMLHVSLSFAGGGGGSDPVVSSFNLDDLLQELGSGSRAANFRLPGDEGHMARYLNRILADVSVTHAEFGSDLSRSYFDHSIRPPTVKIEGGQAKFRINLSTKHGRYPAEIRLESQNGLGKIGMNSPESKKGADTDYSGGGGPTLIVDKDKPGGSIYDDAFTEMIDATIERWGGNQEAAIDEFNKFFNCVGLEDEPITCSASMTHNIVLAAVFPVHTGIGTHEVPEIYGTGETLRDNANPTQMDDQKAASRAKKVLPIGSSRRKIISFLAPDSIDGSVKSDESASVLAHELGHGLLALPDLYSGGKYRNNVQYIGGHCIMGRSNSFAHFCAYNKRAKGWLKDDAILQFDRPPEATTISREVVLIQLEHWDPLLDADARFALAQASLSGTLATGTPVVAAVFLRLGGDGHVFNIIELRGRGEKFSRNIDPPRVLITNAIDINDDTRYGDGEVEGAGTTSGVLERYRRKVHLLNFFKSDDEIGNTLPYDFASDPEFPEVGLSVQALEWGTVSSGSSNFAVVRLLVRWQHSPAIDLGFVDSIPGWQSPDIAILKPEEINEDGSFDFPENQDPDALETFRVPPGPDPDEVLKHKVAVRVHNFAVDSIAVALNVQIHLVIRRPAGAGDWEPTVTFPQTEKVIEQVPPTELPGGDAPVIAFDWPVNKDYDTHVCFRAQIGDRDLPRNDAGIALASDDTSHHNDHTQQNVFRYESKADSPPEPVEFYFQVENGGSYIEEVRLVPHGLGLGARLTVRPAQLRIAPKSRGIFRIRVELEESLLTRSCGKDIEFLLEAWRRDDDSEERWGAAKYIIAPRKRTEITLQGSIMHNLVHLFGHVNPDIGAQRVLLHIQRPGQPSLWERLTLGPASTFNFELSGNFPPAEEVRATAYFDGTREFASSISKTIKLVWHVVG